MKRYILVTECEIDNFKPHYTFFDDYETAKTHGEKFIESITEYPAYAQYNIYTRQDNENT